METINYATEKTYEYLEIEPDDPFSRNSINQRAVSCHKYFVPGATIGCFTIGQLAVVDWTNWL